MPTTPQCPRCGYDLSGLVASWVESCPMEATCAECGLVFNCGNVLNPRLSGPPWSFEHGTRRSFHRFLATSWIALRPWRLGRELSVEHAIRPLRLAVFVAAWLLLIHVAAGIVAALAIVVWNGIASLLRLSWQEWNWLFGTTVLWLYSAEGILPSLIVALLPALLMPLWLVILDETFKLARVRRAHLLRGLAYSLPVAGVAAAAALLFTVAEPWIVQGPLPDPLLTLLPILIVCGPSLCIGIWWWLFIRRYLRLPRAFWIAALNTFMSMLLVAILLDAIGV